MMLAAIREVIRRVAGRRFVAWIVVSGALLATAAHGGEGPPSFVTPPGQEPPGGERPSFVIADGQESLLLSMLQPGPGWPAGWTLGAVMIQRDQAICTYQHGGEIASLRLVHPSALLADT